MSTDSFRDRIALVTGSAGGIGQQVVEALAGSGAVVAAVDRDKDGVGTLAERCTRDGLRVHPYPADVSSSHEVDAAVAGVEAELGPIDVLVNAAGVLSHDTVDELTDDGWLSTFDVNARGVFVVSRAVTRRMVPRGRGAVVTVSSNAATTPRVGMSAYAASKAAATMFTRCLGLEVARHGIRCNVVAPGSTDTAMLRALWDDDHDESTSIAGTPAEYRLGIPLGRIAQPSDVVAAVLFLASDQARHITMESVTVDGGATLGI